MINAPHQFKNVQSMYFSSGYQSWRETLQLIWVVLSCFGTCFLIPGYLLNVQSPILPSNNLASKLPQGFRFPPVQGPPEVLPLVVHVRDGKKAVDKCHWTSWAISRSKWRFWEHMAMTSFSSWTFPYHPWDERYVYLNEWLIFMVKGRSNTPYHGWYGIDHHHHRNEIHHRHWHQPSACLKSVGQSCMCLFDSHCVGNTQYHHGNGQWAHPSVNMAKLLK